MYIPVGRIHRRVTECEKHHGFALVEQRTERVCRRVVAGVPHLLVVRHRHIEQQDRLVLPDVRRSNIQCGLPAVGGLRCDDRIALAQQPDRLGGQQLWITRTDADSI